MMTMEQMMNMTCRKWSEGRTVRERIAELLLLNGRVDLGYAAMLYAAAQKGTFYSSDIGSAWVDCKNRYFEMNGIKRHADIEDYGVVAGGRINALAVNQIIVKTGNTRDAFIPIYDDTYRRVTVYEWKAAFTMEDLEAVLTSLLGVSK